MLTNFVNITISYIGYIVRQVKSSKVYQQIRIKLHTDPTSALAIYNPQALEL